MAKLDLLAIAVVARDMVDKGWTQGTWYRKEGVNEFVCTEGAFQQAMRSQIKNEIRLSLCEELNALTEVRANQIVDDMALSLSRKREQLIFQYLRKVLGVNNIPQWNDNKNRSKDEVMALFDRLVNELSELPVVEREMEFAEVLK